MSFKTFKRLDDNTLMPWGKHRGKKLEDVPAHYLLWLDRDITEGRKVGPFRAGIQVYVNENREVLEKQERENRRQWKRY